MDMIGRIRRLHSRRNKSEREIARITGLSRNTVERWPRKSEHCDRWKLCDNPTGSMPGKEAGRP